MSTRLKKMSSLLSREVNNRNRLLLADVLGGRLQASDISPVRQKILIPEGCRSIRFYGCRPNASIITAISCGISVMNGGLKTETLASSIFAVRSIEIPLDASNCNGEIYFQVLDSNGGMGWWEFVK